MPKVNQVRGNQNGHRRRDIKRAGDNGKGKLPQKIKDDEVV